jgi:hypothetical protein
MTAALRWDPLEAGNPAQRRSTMTNIVGKSSHRVSAAEIRAAFVLNRNKIGSERGYEYTHLGTGRVFTARRSEYARRKSAFFLCEMVPNGRMFDINDKGDIVRAWDEPRIRETESRVGPNELLAALRAMGIDVDALVFWGAGYSVDSIYQDKLTICAESIARAVNENVRYISYRCDPDL